MLILTKVFDYNKKIIAHRGFLCYKYANDNNSLLLIVLALLATIQGGPKKTAQS